MNYKGNSIAERKKDREEKQNRNLWTTMIKYPLKERQREKQRELEKKRGRENGSEREKERETDR